MVKENYILINNINNFVNHFYYHKNKCIEKLLSSYSKHKNK